MNGDERFRIRFVEMMTKPAEVSKKVRMVQRHWLSFQREDAFLVCFEKIPLLKQKMGFPNNFGADCVFIVL